ncbi:MAG: repeat-containing protein [Gemmatimonadetes bacterium]|jgi:hypothetical protein|nr:repeat-containing protein [Gemmatimonadota bacterium]
MNAKVAVLALLAALLPATASAQQHEHPKPGTDRLGTVHFATSCAPAVAPEFDRAVALLHSFEFGASIAGFERVLARDSTCAMAQWGIALSRWTNPMAAGRRPEARLRQGHAAVAAARRLAANATPRERGYIDAVATLYDGFETVDQAARVTAYARAMRELAAREPADTEAAIFHAIALAASASPTDKSYASQLEAGRLLEAMWERMPDHPGLAHYIIHSYDYPALAGKARAAAQRYATIAPAAAHALHMPSHTFTRVGLWEESIETNERSMKEALATGSIAEALHAADYLVYAALQLGREADARRILDTLPALRARFDPAAVTGAAPGSAGVFALAAIPARWVLERRDWKEAAMLQPSPSAWPYAEAMTYLARALGGVHQRDLASARAASDSLSAIGRRLAAGGEAFWAEQVAIQHLTARAWLELGEGRSGEALALMREAVAREDATEKNAVTPGPLVPARELLGDMLLRLGRTGEARAEYRATLVKEPGRRHSMRLAGGTRDGR